MKVQQAQPLMIFVAHPDDETIAAGALISRCTGPVRIVHATDGAPTDMSDAIAAGFHSREEYALRRKDELIHSLSLAGKAPDAITSFSFIDQQLAFHLGKLTLRIAEELRTHRPTQVLTHSYEGGHPDHDSLAFATRMAVEILHEEEPGLEIQLFEFPLYHLRHGKTVYGEFISFHGIKEERHVLTEQEKALKCKMLRCFESQRKILGPFFTLGAEVFRPAPAYDFTRSPHFGKLRYELFNCGVDGATWRALALQTFGTLQPERAVS